MHDLKQTEMTTIEDVIRERSYGLFNLMYNSETRYDNYKLLRVACESQNYHVAERLCKYIDESREMEFITDPIDLILEECEFTVIMFFAKYNWFQLIEKLKGKLSLNYINLREYDEGRTALFIATENSNHLAVKALISIGANPSLGTKYDERRWNDLRNEIVDNLPTYFEDLNQYEQHLYYDYLERYYDTEIEYENYGVRNYLVELANLSDEFFDVYIEDHIISDVTPAMIACKQKNEFLLELLWVDSVTEKQKDSSGINVFDYAISYSVVDFIFKKLAPYKLIENVEKILCSICQTEDSNVMTTCKHLYCEKCLLRWLNIKQNCPMCRKQFYSL